MDFVETVLITLAYYLSYQPVNEQLKQVVAELLVKIRELQESALDREASEWDA